MTTCIGRHDTDADTPPDADIGQLCSDHFTRMRTQLVTLPAVATWLEVNLAAGGSPGERVSGTREDPMPLRKDVLDLIGPASREHVRPTPGVAPPRFVVWSDGELVADCPSWTEAAATAREAMLAEGVPVELVAVVTDPRPVLHDEDGNQLVDRESAQQVLDRWQVRPTTRGGWDQQGIDAVVATLRHWAGQVAADGPFPWTGWSERNTVTGLVGWLSARLSWLAGQDWAAEFAGEVAELTTAAHRLAPWREEIRRDPDPCPVCAARAVVLHIAAAESRCESKAGGCGRVQPLSEYVLAALLPGTRRAG